MSSVLVTGANRGIGLGLARNFLSHPSVSTVIATARDVYSAKELKAINSPKLHIFQLEVVSEESIANAVKKVGEMVGVKGLDFLIHNAGVGYETPLNGELSKAKISEMFEVNAIAPMIISNKFCPLLKKAAANKGSAQITMISSGVGSLENAINMPKEMPYTGSAMSKCAVNMLTRRIAVEWKDDHIRATTFCPGWVKTNLGSDNGLLTVDESTIPLTKFILSLSEEHNGQYYQHTGERIPW